MTTAADIIKSALRKLRVVDAAMALDPVDFETGRDALNRMMIRWEADGLPMGWTAVVGPTDVVGMPVEAEEAVIANLAVGLQSEYGSEVSSSTADQAVEGLNRLRRDVFTSTATWLNTDEPCSVGVQGFDLNIIRGSYY